jgi:hypothetical protein
VFASGSGSARPRSRKRMKDSRSLISYSHRSSQRGPKLHNIHQLRVSRQIIT